MKNSNKNIKYASAKNKSIKHNIIKNNPFIFALIILCVIFILLKLTFLDHATVWDESVYLGMGKYLYSQGELGLWEMIRPLGLPIVTGLFWKVGFDQLIASRIFALLISLGIIIFTFLIAKELFGKKSAILSAIILAFTPIFFYYSEYVLTDHISTLLLLISIYLFIREKFVLGSVFGGIAFLFKFTSILYFGVIILFILYKMFRIFILKEKSDSLYNYNTYKKRIKIPRYLAPEYSVRNIFLAIKKSINRSDISKIIYSLIIILFFVGLYFVSNYMLYHNHFNSVDAILRPYTDAARYSNNLYQNTQFNDFSSFMYYLFYYFYNILFNSIYGFIVYIFAIIYFLDLFRLSTFFTTRIRNTSNKDNLNKHVILLLTFIVYIIYFSVIPYKNERFEIFFLPMLAIFSSYGILRVWDHLTNPKTNDEYIFSIKSSKILTKLIKIIFILIIIILFSISINKIHQFYKWQNYNEKIDFSIEKYMDINNISGVILTTDPRFVVYSEKRYVGAYDVLNNRGLFVNDWESEINFSAIIYNDKLLPCYNYDSNCMSHKNDLQDIIQKDFIKKDSYIYHDSEIIFYIRK
ncbi:MAG: ArnT family glycosyltransferase [Candidatus Woesearchaeota archaeon]